MQADPAPGLCWLSFLSLKEVESLLCQYTIQRQKQKPNGNETKTKQNKYTVQPDGRLIVVQLLRPVVVVGGAMNDLIWVTNVHSRVPIWVTCTHTRILRLAARAEPPLRNRGGALGGSVG